MDIVDVMKTVKIKIQIFSFVIFVIFISDFSQIYCEVICENNFDWECDHMRTLLQLLCVYDKKQTRAGRR
jgi:hypothetical protein